MNIVSTISFVFTLLFLIVVVSYYVLLFIKRRPVKSEMKFSSITVIIPAHNEERYIKDCVKSVKQATFDGLKEIIVVDDGSKDKTPQILKFIKGIKVITVKHAGKSAAINRALKVAKGELVSIVDGDSVIHKNSLMEMKKSISEKSVAGVTGIIKVKNRKKFVCWWIQVEQLYNSLMRSLFTKIDANICTPGPLSMYRKDALKKLGGFSTDGFSEDFDITIRLIREGYKIRFAYKSVAETNMPYTFKWFLKQRSRFARGMHKVFKKHLRVNTTIIDLYTLPILLFTYFQGVIMGVITFYQIISGYMTYFVAKGVLFDWLVVKFFFEWFSIVGFVKWFYRILIGIEPLTALAIVGIISTLLTYPLYILAIVKYERKIDIFHLIPIIFMAPFWWFIMIIYIFWLPEIFRKKQYNIWEKET